MIFPHQEPFEVAGESLSAAQIVEFLGPQISERRRQRIDAVVAARCYSIAPVLDGIYDRGNISAVMRTAEGLGCGECHVIETQDDFKAANRVTQGADKWLDITRWGAPATCMEHLRARGFQIVATELEASVPLAEIDFSAPTALVFGNERDGVCPEVLEVADARVIIPMGGFAQSFNISVAGALTLYHAMRERVRIHGDSADLDQARRNILRAEYYLRSVDAHEPIVRRMLNGHG